MSIKDYMDIIWGVLKSPYVIGTVVVMILVIKFAKFVASYKRKPPKVKVKKGGKNTEAAPAAKADDGAQKAEESSEKEAAAD